MTAFNKHDLSKFVGTHLVYTYDNGWNYEIYVKNSKTLDYRIHSGVVANRWVKDQRVALARIASDVYKISWVEPTGTNVSVAVNLADKIFHGSIYFARWIINNTSRPGATLVEQSRCFQNDHLAEIQALRDKGPVIPVEFVDEFATITFMRHCGENDESVINCAASELPADFPNNLR